MKVYFSFLFGIALFSLSPAKATTYVVDSGPPSPGATVTGFITTDGAVGVLSAGDITDWNLTITCPSSVGAACNGQYGSFSFLGPNSGNDSTMQLVGSSLVATSSTLTFNYNNPNFSTLQFNTLITPVNRVVLDWCGPQGNYCPQNFASLVIYADAPLLTPPVFVSTITYGESGILTIGQATPLPASLPLFATGLGGLGLLGWCRKRKQATA
jgi:hypothetical protein